MTHADRVRKVTPDSITRDLDRATIERLRAFETQDEAAIAARIRELDAEWDIERVLATNAATLGLTGLVLGVVASRRWLIVPGVVLPFLLQHALQGWCPPLPIFRRLGIRTRREIDRERFALKILRGDVSSGDRSAEDAWRAAGMS